MPSPFGLASSLLAAFLLPTAFAQDATCGSCQSYGVDFVSGGSYFQNSLSTDPFSAVQEFEGCSNDTSNNVLVDPNGDQYECTTTPLQPDDTPETFFCPLDKNQLYSGEWSLLIISNNGDCEPIAFERDFSLSVGPQQTTTVSPTITVSTVSTPIESDTVTSTRLLTSTAKPRTTTVPKINLSPTLTIQPLPAISYVSKALLTITETSTYLNIIAQTTATATPSCVLPQRRRQPDPIASIVATILADLGLKNREAAPQPTARSGTTEFKRAILEGRAVEPKVKARFLQERRDALALNKRAPDEPTLTVTDPSASIFTETELSIAPTSTVIGTTTLLQTTTTTPTVTVSKGIAVSIAIVTAAQRTITNTFFVPLTTVFRSTTTDATLTITATSTPSDLAASCSSAGGQLV